MRNDFHLRLRLFIAVSFVVAALGCRGDADKRSSSDSSTRTPAPTVSATPVTAVTTPLTEPNVASVLEQINIGDSALGRLAEYKSESQEVKDFASRMMREHHDLQVKGIVLQDKLGITPDSSITIIRWEWQEWFDSLKYTPKGPAFDAKYFAREILAHEAALKTVDNALATTKNEDLRNLLEETREKLRRHLADAKKLRDKL